MLLVVNIVNILKPGSVSPVTLELGLVLKEMLVKPTHVETKLMIILQIMVINILRQWDIFWCSERKLIWVKLLLLP